MRARELTGPPRLEPIIPTVSSADLGRVIRRWIHVDRELIDLLADPVDSNPLEVEWLDARQPWRRADTGRHRVAGGRDVPPSGNATCRMNEPAPSGD